MFHLKHANTIQSVLMNLEESDSIEGGILTSDDVVALFDCMNDHYAACNMDQDSWAEYPNLRKYCAEELDNEAS